MKKPDEDERRNTRWLAGYDYETQREVTQKGRCNVVQAIATAPVRVQCIICKAEVSMEVPIEGLVKWKQGVLIQDALPALSRSEREMLISQTCGTCFNDMFEEVEDE